ncbi:Uncharacterised protein [Lysinibacillus sphaericus]|nr:Uncharacterised protein [Lysinibacillus sphaericus]
MNLCMNEGIYQQKQMDYNQYTWGVGMCHG